VFSNEDYLAQLLAEAGMVSPDEVARARNALSGSETIIEHLLAHTHLTQEGVAQTLAANAGIGFVRLEDVNFDPSITEAISDEIAKRYRVIPVEDDGLVLTIAIADPLDFETLDTLPHVIGRELNLVCATQQDIQEHLKQFYNIGEPGSATDADGYSVTSGDAEAGDSGDDAPIIRLVLQMLSRKSYYPRLSRV
jgi:type IV pilus assembly protein PilB